MVPESGCLEPPSAKCARCAFHVREICESPAPAHPLPSSMLCTREGPTDEELIKRDRTEKERGLPRASFGMLFERHHRHVVAWICRITRDLDLAVDLAQDVFIKVFIRIHAFRSDSRFTTWLYSVSRNCVYDHAKARAARPREVGEQALSTAAPVTGNAALDRIAQQEERKVVATLLREARLDELERRVLLMHVRDDLPLDAITNALRLTNASGAKAPIVSAKRKLRLAAERWARRQTARRRLDDAA